VQEEARALVAPAWEALSLSVPPSSSKTELRFLWESLVEASMENPDRQDGCEQRKIGE
jgi:hypothetical protein